MKQSGRRWSSAPATLALFAVLLAPWTRRLRAPSIVWDDVPRVVDLQTLSLGERMTRPFNEHLAPFFELVTAAAWEVAGHRLEAAPMAFTLAAFVPFVLSLGMLWGLALREWRSATVAGVAVTLLAATPIHGECVLSFSGSSFSWAMSLTLGALGMAGLARDRGSARWAAGSAAACLLAPTASAIGLLAGPVATIRAWPGRKPAWPPRAEALALAPVMGTAANLLIAAAFRYRDVLAHSNRSLRDIPGGLAAAVRAPLHLVLAGYAGLGDASRLVPLSASALALALALGLVIAKAARGPADTRRWLAIGVALIGCGYAMIYCFRASLIAPETLVRTSRYHLFPCLGLALLLCGWAAPRLRRLDGRPLFGGAVMLALALALAVINGPSMKKRVDHYRGYSDQGAVLAMIDRVADVARSRGLGRDQVIGSLESLEPRWTPVGWNIMRMLPETPDARPNGLGAARVRSAIRDGLSARDRALLFADMDATSRLRPGPTVPQSGGWISGRLVGVSRNHPLGRPGLYRADGWPSHLEWDFPPGGPPPQALSLPGLSAGKTLEVWWPDEAGGWSPERRVVVRLDPRAAGRSDWALPLDGLPQVPAGGRSRVRVTVREPGQFTLGTPALLR